jgi:hypothetical protein
VRAFTCPDCGQLVVFESLTCLHSQTPLGFDWDARDMRRLRDAAPCANRELIACNGLAAAAGELCASCALTRTRPATADAEGVERFAKAENAKRRLLFELLELGLPVAGAHEREGGLAFDLLNSEHEAVTTGHADGLITLDLAEADDAHRARMREQMQEPYRTLLGHLRHEIAHYYEPILCPAGTPQRARYRELFGDERASYQAAMDRHYAQGPPEDWAERFVSAYATMHPWEDWAETFAHYLHIRDTLQTAAAYGVTVTGPAVLATDAAPLHSFPAAASDDVRSLLDAWLPLTYALNALNRSMGADDIYPFVLAPPAIDKLAFVDELVRGAGSAA